MTAPRHSGPTPFLASSFTWNFALGMTHLLIPLFAYELGMSGVEIGSLISLPIVIQIWVNLVGGAWSDRIGARNVMLAAAVLTAVSAVVFALSASFLDLMLGQVLQVFARAAFWPANWALGSQLPGDRSHNLGRLNAWTSAGHIAGTAASGILIVQAGFRAGFWCMAAICVASFATAMMLANPRADRAAAPASMIAAYRPFITQRWMLLAIAYAFISALPYSIGNSFVPILLVEQGFSSDAAGWLLALRSAGTIAAGVILARFVQSTAARGVVFASSVATAIAVVLLAVAGHPAAVALLLVGMGLGSGVVTLFFQVLITGSSGTERRGAAMALGGMGWNVSNFAVPVVTGALRDALDIQAAFVITGALVLAWALALWPLHRWAIAADGTLR